MSALRAGAGVEAGRKAPGLLLRGPDGILGLVAVAEGLLHADDGLHGDVRKAAEAREIPPDKVLLEGELLLVGKLLHAAAAAASGFRAGRGDPVGGGDEHLLDPRVGVGLFRSRHAGEDRVADHGVFHKKGEAIGVSDAFTVVCHVFDMYFYKVVFLHAYSPVLRRLESKKRLKPSHSISGEADSSTSDMVSSLASVLSARFRARASMIAGFLGEPYSYSP